MTDPIRVAGVILCGGKSSRMGQPKEWLQFDGETMLARTARILAEVVQPIVVVAAPEQELPLIDIPCPVIIVHDSVADQGPLMGIAEGLEALPEEIEAAYVSSCDVPLLRPELVRFMISKLGDSDIAMPVSGDRAHPLAGVYRRSVAKTARRLLSPASSLQPPASSLCEEHPTVRVSADELSPIDPHLESLHNINTTKEYENLMSEWEKKKTSDHL